jgi:hypothetical protein
MKVIGILSLLVATNAIYNDDHWTYATKLTPENADAVVNDAIEAGKTMFVRWIASEG